MTFSCIWNEPLECSKCNGIQYSAINAKLNSKHTFVNIQSQILSMLNLKYILSIFQDTLYRCCPESHVQITHVEEHWEPLHFGIKSGQPARRLWHFYSPENMNWGQCMTGVDSPPNQEAWLMEKVLDMAQTVEYCSRDRGYSVLMASLCSVGWSLG